MTVTSAGQRLMLDVVFVVRDLVARHTTRATLGVFGEDAVNVVELNLALDEEL